MTITILSALCAIALGTGNISAVTDTVNVYTVDYKQVKNFDGSQLVGKKIESYSISTVDVGDPNKVMKFHVIVTDAAPKTNDGDPKIIETGEMSSIKIVTVNPNNQPLAFIVDGEMVSKDYVDKLNPKDISSMEILKGNSGDDMCEKYGLQGGAGIVIIHTKK